MLRVPDAGIPDGSTVSAQCNSCLRSDEAPDGGTYGPSIRVGGTTVANVAGCVEIANRRTPGSRARWQSRRPRSASNRACRPSCPVTDNPSRAAYVACTKLAAAGTCLTFPQAAVALLERDGRLGHEQRATKFCFSSSNPFTQFEKLAAYFCTS